ncbi:hypothetical protein C2E21_5028 [Chlorella sorokiniana]|uniref:Uncharacterized protein n=1 Tax=Chlorella sorokiniana TaxID=3076 RepID=A0A2P6TPF3_CHLSO|nr:hypothetical protein C2E21_5028 [Chlorella sorokiniana]PRW55915.1 hypothetical protein C2E21_5028 [Chlorella sorokiniana]|eukprot:PRW55914.1 hypothetical protein C2E21_5028 [Chlorella sorokiniana]
MLLLFRCLLRAQPECKPLQAIVNGWGGYSTAQRQAVFDAALIVASRGLWSRLEEQLAQELGQGLPAE